MLTDENAVIDTLLAYLYVCYNDHDGDEELMFICVFFLYAADPTNAVCDDGVVTAGAPHLAFSNKPLDRSHSNKRIDNVAVENGIDTETKSPAAADGV